MNIFEKILEIQKTIQVEKTGINEKHGFMFFREEDVTNAVKAEMNKHGIIVRYEIETYNHEAFYDAHGRYRPRASGVVRFTFISVEDGSEMTISVGAEGSGTGDDVSSRKFSTQARKIAFLQAFQIGEANDRFDSDGSDEQPAVNMTEPVDPSAGLNDLTAKVGEMIRDESPVDGPMVNAVGTRLAAELGASADQKEWKRDVRVMAALVKALENGEAE